MRAVPFILPVTCVAGVVGYRLGRRSRRGSDDDRDGFAVTVDETFDETIDERERALEAITAELSSAFAEVSVAGLGDLVVAALATIADDVGADVAFATTVADDALADVWQWAAPGVQPGPAAPVGTPVAVVFPSSIDRLRNARAVLVDDILAEPLAPHEREWFEACDARAVAVLPVVHEAELAGVVGFVGTSRQGRWGTSDLHRLRFFGDLLVDAVARTRSRAAAATADARARRITDFIPDGLLAIDGEADVISWASPSVYRVTGWRPAELTRRPLAELLPAGGVEAVATARRTLADGAPEVAVRARLETGSGEERWFDLTLTLVEFSAELPSELLVSVRDVHERQLNEDRLEAEASTDPLTGLLNRSGLRNLLDERERTATEFALALCDLDGFKAVNDTFGHQAGDEVLVAVARRLRTALGEEVGLARLGGDEFVVVLDGADKRAVQDAADAIVATISQPIATSTGACRVTASVGITLPSRPHSVRVLLAEADAAMYRAKRAGKSCWELTEL